MNQIDLTIDETFLNDDQSEEGIIKAGPVDYFYTLYF